MSRAFYTLIQEPSIGSAVVVVVGAAAGDYPQSTRVWPRLSAAIVAARLAIELGESQLEPGLAQRGGGAPTEQPAARHAAERSDQTLVWARSCDQRQQSQAHDPD